MSDESEILTPEEQARYEALSPEAKAYYHELKEETARIRAMPVEEKVDLIMDRVAELIAAFYLVQRATADLQAKVEVLFLAVGQSGSPQMRPNSDPQLSGHPVPRDWVGGTYL